MGHGRKVWGFDGYSTVSGNSADGELGFTRLAGCHVESVLDTKTMVYHKGEPQCRSFVYRIPAATSEGSGHRIQHAELSQTMIR